ncbi:hypothetical protein N4G70_30810 [Streptomyces sp. ASQP_92]|uniref:hypothetical protein n=1 Tax=Streptomyces sp. ASQP_92 TaxID=2979116 RepID=UPI0021C22CD7|nr:hypothetical protein [Streptomyces sp. ASQP_92]MCT9093223.1 hypothetical protein [Streptomyces sp. ASQP_92]
MASDLSPIPDEPHPNHPSDESHLDVLRIAAMSRPLDEVASLAHLLNQTGEQPRPGDEALHMAAVSRPLDEVRELISLLKKPPHTDEEADMALRAAATERPVEEVAALIASLRPEADVPRVEPRPPQAVSLARFGPAAAAPPAPEAAPAPPAPDASQAPPRPGMAPATPAAPPPPMSAPARRGQAPVADDAPAPAASRTPALRSVLRWPAAAALLLVGVIHLPTDIMAVRSGSTASQASVVIAAVCLTLACLLALYDTVWAWGLGAAAAVATAAAHSVGAGLNSVHLLRDSLGSTFTGATTLAVLCAVVAAVLAATVLLRKPGQRAADKA